MPKIVSLVPKWRFEAAGVTPPKTWETIFTDGEDDAVLLAACHDADVLLAPPGFQKITANLLRGSVRLKLVQESGVEFRLFSLRPSFFCKLFAKQVSYF